MYAFVFRGIVKKNVHISGNLLSFWKKSVYCSHADLKNIETSTYQEINIPELRTEPSYQNTLIR